MVGLKILVKKTLITQLIEMIKLSKRFLIVAFIAIPGMLQAQVFGGNAADIKWMQLNNKYSKVIFPIGLDSQASRISNLISLLENEAGNSLGNKFRKWNVVLQNQTIIPNAYVRLAPVISELYLTPDQNNFSNGSIRWDDNLIIHEQRHMQQFANFNNGLTKVFSFFLGQEGQLLANGISIPDYFFEGDAVWQETLVSNQGRGRMPSFYNGMKSLMLENKNYSWMKLRSGSLQHYTPTHYELGYQLIAYGYEKYGTDFWKRVTTDAVNFKGFFYSFNHAIERYAGKSYKDFRNDALNYFKQQTLQNINKEQQENFISPANKNNVTDYLFPAFVSNDTLLVTKKSYKEINSFYFIINGKEEKLRVKDYVIDDYFSYRNGKIAYAAYQSDPRWGNRNYSVLQLLDIYSNEQRQLSFKSKYFSPDINDAGTEVIAVNVNPDGSNQLHRLNANTGELIYAVPNPANYYITQTKYIDPQFVVSAVRNPKGEMALVKIKLDDGKVEILTDFSYNVIGYPVVKNRKVFFSRMDNNKNTITADRIFAVDLESKKLYRITNNSNGVYQPCINENAAMVYTAFTAEGNRLVKQSIADFNWKNNAVNVENTINDIAAATALKNKGSNVLYQLVDSIQPVTAYKKSFQLFNFHSARPFASDPEFGYTFYSDNILNSFSNNISYTYNRNEGSHGIGYNAIFAGWFPYLSLGAEYINNRNIDTALGKGIQFNAAKFVAGINIPLSFINGRTFKYLNFGTAYSVEQIPYIGIGKDVFDNRALRFSSAFISFRNVSRQAIQHINPRWAQSIVLNYKDAYTFYKGHKFLAASSFYFPGLFTNHSLVFNLAFQKRDSLPDLFSNNFPYSRGYQGLSTRRMYKLGVNYHFPIVYPDWGFGNMLYFQRIRANVFFDYTNAKARVNGVLQEIINKSTGAEIYFDTKLWNALPASIGIRYSHLLDTDLRNTKATGRWEIILPINLIPN